MKYCPKCQQEFDDPPGHCPADGSPLSLPDPYHLVGRTLIEKYRIDALIGIGGMGAVYNAHHLAINRRVAFKILLPNLALGNEKMLNLFQREAETAGQLLHENIVDVKDAGRTPDGLAYIVMEWLEGRTLEEALSEKRQFGFARIEQTLRQIAAALDYAHARLIVHRDLKPSNIMLTPRKDGSEQVKVVDFGIAKVINDSAASPVSRIMGTPHYSSPEQFRIGANIDGRADIYSLGVLLFEMLTGRLPFEGETAQEIMAMHRSESPPPARRFRPETPAVIEQLVERMLAKEPQFRPHTAAEAAEVFKRVINSPDQAKTAPQPIDITNDAAPVPTSGKSAPERREPNLPPTEIEETIVRSGRVTAPSLPNHTTPEETADHTTHKTHKTRLKWLAGIVLVTLLFCAGLLLRQLITPAGRSEQARELMVYQLEIFSADGKSIRRASGDTPLAKGETFKFHFTPRESGYLYIVAPGAQNNPSTFLTSQPDKEAGVTSNLAKAGSDFGFPAHPDSWLGITEGESKMDFTLIFSSTPLSAPGFLDAPARHKLSGEEQHELTRLRQQPESIGFETSPDVTRILIKTGTGQAAARMTRPAVVELTVRRRQ